MKLISISGLIGSGKDTMASYLVEEHGYVRLSFSSALKDVVASLFHWDRTMLEGSTETSRAWREEPDLWWTSKLDFGVTITPRFVLQNIGTDLFREKFHPDIWILALQRKLIGQDKVVISDARFFNELAMVKEMGGKTLGVYREYPKWLQGYYKEMDSLCKNFGNGFMDTDMRSPASQARLMQIIETETTKKLGLHASELPCLLWNEYDGMIDNTGALLDSYRQLEKFCEDN